MKAIFFLSIMVVLMACSPATTTAVNTNDPVASTAKSTAADGITGIWEMTSSTPRGKRTSRMDITQSSPTMATAIIDKQPVEMSISGKNISWENEISTPMGKMSAAFSGIIDGNSMRGMMKMASGPMAGREMEWTAVRK